MTPFTEYWIICTCAPESIAVVKESAIGALLAIRNESGNEILKWLHDNKLYKYDSYCKTDHDYAILDDDNDMLYQQRNNFFECNAATDGLSRTIADKVIAFLNTEEI